MTHHSKVATHERATISFSYHIRLFRKNPIIDALRCKPFNGEFDNILMVLSEVLFRYVNALRQPKVSNFDHKVNVNPKVQLK